MDGEENKRKIWEMGGQESKTGSRSRSHVKKFRFYSEYARNYYWQVISKEIPRFN